MDERCIVCANGNDLPDGECCRACGRQAGPASHDDELDALRQHLCRHSIREHYASATLRIAELEAELARVREELEIEKAKFPAIGSPLQKLGALLADLLDEDRFAQAEQFMLAEYADKERVARRAAELLKEDAMNEIDWIEERHWEFVSVDEAVAQAMREEG